ncbi:hypothetical protein DID78_01330 [Candidatus Marinamargulisbacteria bacterium SCGC AG-343-D04]|nr:hypothetical protein DID78_01330 [Candidatus Marinamargulisbacteria bacterium SCGC AG-343-D04]
MSIKYCKSCEKIVPDEKSLLVSEVDCCMVCKKPLLYFGREKVVLSVQELLDQYDLMHKYNPLKDYQGVYKVYRSQESDIRLLECEDCLKHFPENKEALFYISKDSWQKGHFQKAKEYLDTLFSFHNPEKDEMLHYVTVLFALKDFSSVVTFVQQYKNLFDSFYFSHSLAMAYLGLKDQKKALKFFYNAFKYCKSKERKSKIKLMIRHLTSLVDKKV